METGWVALVACFLAFALMFPGWAFLGAVRAGDAKLLMAVAALLGWQTGARACLLTYILSIPYGILVLTLQGRWGSFLVVLQALWGRSKGQKKELPKGTRVVLMPVVTAAVFLAISTQVLHFF